ncbi:2-oxoglutarate dehydrogenase complex dihydrolipoyllysine-residue succinyltransferase [Methylococcus sp. EFPC2]|uniref:2-oxoglutarate dehydrogenase complex dihydrolipoyllysine-residue succinyltransferase n=1 Tax=Methylococcus sp. EFPC2 TaxID=2812648 RepID=UPI001967F638|nr:2-oxoglutarate dehydrogenase complex dihydrolipoyllysine-residue succinyltransferase [Methylococcus sp. EFPC2]QSA96210.1 2-oxoglutarate dehydrogenase complex dihydrolipoyllysine-residue succinyltransferase [Methylococcus sp. EFPC2]
MHIEVAVPQLPESLQDATLLDWRKQVGERVSRGETLVELETDKVVLDVPAVADGVLSEIKHVKGDVVTGGTILAVLDTEAAAAAPATVEKRPVLTQPLSPAVRRLLTEHGLEPSQIPGADKGGRLTKEDVLDYLATRASAAPAAEATSSTPAPPAEPASSLVAGRIERRVPMTRLRARIAERLVESQRQTATLTTFNEVNLQKVFDLRNLYKARFEQEHHIKLGFMSFFVKASVEALKRFPVVNASIDGDDIVHHDYYDIGIAVSTDRGLVVPVLRDADKLDFGSIEKAVAEFSRKARDGRLSFEELTGGTFSITNGGIFGSMLSTPILNPPQSGILGMHAIKERPVVENGQIVIRPMIYLAFSYDHRLIDGREAVQFLYTIKELLEDPARMVLNV